MTIPRQETRRTLPLADLFITLTLTITFAAGLVTSLQWSVRAALFPRFVTVLGLGLALVHLVTLLVGVARTRRDGASVDSDAARAPAAARPGDEDEADADVEYVFAQAGLARWSRSLAWVGAFFVGLYVLGLYVIAPLFALLYLRLSAKRSWRFSAVYGAVTVVGLYAALEYALQLSVPPGLF